MNTDLQQAGQAGAAGEPLGLRLRHAREAAGLSVAQVGERLRLPSAIVDAMEREDFARLGAPIYARSHLGGYLRLLGLPLVLMEGALTPAPPPALVTTSHVARSHYLIDRFARRAVYVVLTASIVLPVVWLATRDQLPGRPAVASLDEAPVAAGQDGGVPAASSPSVEERQVVASLAPFYREPVAQAPQPPLAAATAPAGQPEATPAADTPTLQLSFDGPSWVEVLGHDGRRLEVGLVEGGQARSFALSDIRSVAIGDADAVDVRMDGDSVDLAPYRRAKVARFTLSSDGKLNPAGD